MKQLSAASTFEDYVKAVSEIVTERGRTIFRALTGKETLPQYEVADPKGDALSDLKERLSKAHPQLDENTVARMADLIEFNNYLVDHEQLKSDYTDKLTKNRTDYAHKITTQEKESLHNPLDWTRWWYWVILYFVIAIGFGINRALMRNPSFDQAKLVDNVHALIMWLFWLGVIAKNGYNLWFHGKDKAFIAQHKQNIVVLKQAADDREKAILTEYEEQRQALENKSGWQAHCGDFLPEYYRNPTDTQALYEILSNGRADTFKEAYEVLANQKQRELMARHERMQTEAAQRAAQAQQQAANETAALAQRQAQAAEDQAREVERHNREVEARWR